MRSRLVAALVGLVAALALAEGALRVAWGGHYRETDGAHVPDPELGWVNAPNHVG